ncbi:aminotransferase class I/II-fold pyridoxal phosphate-dependent enzyme [Asticcacaulis solisilvae]|uniref:aminotransferase class I/II-fold pyridoxal phosphate-dependent enzyme n=1 Tax=Asticcacaulis solisilvae TaxID=1217274 RepID=UPI003FD8EF1C
MSRLSQRITPAPAAPDTAPEIASQRIAIARPYMPATAAILPYLESIEQSGWYSNFGPVNQALEARLATRFKDGTRIVTVSNATLGLTACLKALKLPQGSLCALPSWTFVATAHAVTAAGLTPWFVDVREDTWMLDPETFAAQLKHAPGPVSAVIPVCAFGQRLDLDAWTAYDRNSPIRVVIDAAAAYDTATTADIPVVVSLHATKALGAGEGGFVAGPRDFVERVRSITAFGFYGTRESLRLGTNAKISEYTAAVAMAAMDNWTATRQTYQRVAQRLRILLMNAPVAFQDGWGLDWITSVCVAHVGDGRSAEVAEALAAQGIDTRMWWGMGCHTSRAFAEFPRTPLPVTERLAASTLGLPYFAAMGDEDIIRLATVLGHYLR